MRSKKSPAALVEVLFGAYRRRILAELLLHPDQSFYVRELARLTGVPAGSLHREIKLLTGAGLLQRSAVGNQVRYRVDAECPLYEDLAAIFRKTAGLADVLREALGPLREKLDSAVVFGSMARGKGIASSDVDVLVIGSASFSAVVQALSAATARLRREVNPIVMTKAAFTAKLAKGDRFVRRVAHEPKILLLGDGHEFGEPSAHRPAQGAPTGR